MVRSAFTMLSALAVVLTYGGDRDRSSRASISSQTSTVVASSLAPALGAPWSSRDAHTGIDDTTSAQPGTTVVNRYMSYDSSAKSVAITLIAAANSALGGFNFNGGSTGNQTITVPLGWTVDIDF